MKDRYARDQLWNAKRRKMHLATPDLRRTYCKLCYPAAHRWSTDPQETECKKCLRAWTKLKHRSTSQYFCSTPEAPEDDPKTFLRENLP